MAKPPFLEDDSQLGISRSAFRKMRKAEKRELMVRWFHQNYEDPSQRTPHDEGEFVYIWGGPYDARDELSAKFGDIASEALIEEAITEVQEDGTFDWAPVRKDSDYQEGVDEDYEEGPPIDAPETLDDFSDERSPTYGSPAELAARKRAFGAVENLQKAIDRPRPVGIGHNRPPEEIENVQLRELRHASIELKVEFGKPEPSIPTVKKWGKSIWDFLVFAGKAVGAGIFAGIGKHLGDQLADPLIHFVHTAYNEIFHWLMTAAQLLPYAM
jgi:hypothetical protein